MLSSGRRMTGLDVGQGRSCEAQNGAAGKDGHESFPTTDITVFVRNTCAVKTGDLNEVRVKGKHVTHGRIRVHL